MRADPSAPDGVVLTEGPHEDRYGHGTACAGIIRSLAPDAELVSVRVLGTDLRGSADWFGEIALFRDVPRTATVRAIEDLVLQGLDRAVFIPAVTGHGESHDVADAQIERWLALS